MEALSKFEKRYLNNNFFLERIAMIPVHEEMSVLEFQNSGSTLVMFQFRWTTGSRMVKIPFSTSRQRGKERGNSGPFKGKSPQGFFNVNPTFP